jgi:hypothetical protein
MPLTKKLTCTLEAATPDKLQLTTETEDTLFTEEPIDCKELNTQLQATIAVTNPVC